MVALAEDPGNIKVYTVNGASSSSASSLPDWLTRKRAAKGSSKKRVIKERVEGTIDLVQEFEFPEASNKIKTTRDGHHAVATGVYKPQMRVYDLDQLTLKFERHTDAENVDFCILSDDWTKSVHLQADRSVELHTQGGFHYRTRIPRFGRAIAYHFPSCDALVATSGNEIYRLNLDQGRFMNPLVLQGDGDGIAGVNAIDINAAHQLLAFGIELNGTVEFWDPRSRSRVGLLRLPVAQLLSRGGSAALNDIQPSAIGVSVTAISSRADGLSYAIGTSTGHTLLYDIRSPRPFATKDLGYGLPVKNVAWIEGGSRMAGAAADGMILSADKKVIKIWERNSPSTNFASITPAYSINDVHHIPGTGLIMLANEGIQMTSFYIPQLGPAPRWCSFLDNITEELEDQTVRNVYEDYKFVERDELAKLGLDHLVGTPALKPYMHGYFLSLRLYDTARVIANPFAYAEHREKLLKEKMEKMAETRIRTKKDLGAAASVKVNRALAERIEKDREKERKKGERKERRRKERESRGEDVEMEDVEEEEDSDAEPRPSSSKDKPTLLSDPRFKALFDDPDFEVDEGSREFNLLNPSLSAQRERERKLGKKKTKTAVEEEAEESDKDSSDGISRSGSDDEGGKEDGVSGSEDSSDAGDLDQFDPRGRGAAHDEQRKSRAPQELSRRPAKSVRMVSARPTLEGGSRRASYSSTLANASFGQRRKSASSSNDVHPSRRTNVRSEGNAGAEFTWVPSADASEHDTDHHSSSITNAKGRGKDAVVKRRGIETFGAGLERGHTTADGEMPPAESDRQGRTKRRLGIRSGSKNTFRGL